MRVALYLRVSTHDDRQHLDTQRLPLNDFCHTQGWTHVTEYADEASASNLRERTAWRRLMDDASRRQFDLLLVWRLDRMARSVFDAAQSLQQLRHWSVGLRPLQEPRAPSARRCTSSQWRTPAWSVASCVSGYGPDWSAPATRVSISADPAGRPTGASRAAPPRCFRWSEAAP